MTAHPEVDTRALRRYLLGDRDDEEAARRLDERVLADDLFFEQLEAAEVDLIDDYLAGNLSTAERERFETNFLTTAERREKLAVARALRRYARRRHTVFARFAPYWKGAAAALLVVGLALVVWRVFIYESELDKGLRLLAEANRGYRSVEARVSGLGHAPLLGPTRGPSPDAPPPAGRAERALQEALEDSPSPAARHALGRFYLDQGRVGEAVAQLEAALADAPDNARLNGDLGAAYLERGKLAGEAEAGAGLEDFARALTRLNRALELDPSLLEPLFNRALCYERMPIPARAAEAWREYLARDPASPWAEEARVHLRALERRGPGGAASATTTTTQRFLTARAVGDDGAAWEALRSGRTFRGSPVVNSLLDDYVAAALAGRDGEAHERLDALDHAARLEVERAGDHFTRDLARAYGSASRPRLASLAEARRLMQAGHERLGQLAYEEAQAHYTQAGRLFAQAGDPAEAAYVNYPLGQSLLSRASPAESLPFFDRAIVAGEASRYEWLRAQALYGSCGARLSLNHSSSLRQCGLALELSERVGDAAAVARAAIQIAQAHFVFNDVHESLRLQQRGVELTLKLAPPEPPNLWLAYFTTALPLNSLGLYDAAIEFQREALRMAEAMKVPGYVSRTHVNLGLMCAGKGDHEEALRHLRTAFEIAESIETPSTRSEALAYASLQSGHLQRRAGDDAAALDHFSRASRFYDELGDADEAGARAGEFHAFSYAAHKGKLLACLKLGACPSAAEEIETTLRLFEQYRPRIIEQRRSNIFFDAEQDICDVATDFDLTRRGDARAAFDRAEGCRARSLYAALNHAPGAAADVSRRPAPLALSELQARVPPRTQVVEYAVLDDKLLVWVVGRERVAFAAQPVGREELTARVERFLRLVTSPPPAAGDDAELKREAAALYDLLVAPVAHALDADAELCFVADKILNRLPFVALLAPGTGRFIGQDFAVTRAPSANLFVIASEEARRRGGPRDEKLLSVGDPDFDHRAFPDLRALSAARGEAERVAEFYVGARPFLGGRAEEELVTREMQRSDVVHLATHAWVDERAPERSGLLLAAADTEAAGADAGRAAGGREAKDVVLRESAGDDDDGQRGVLRASEVDALRLPRTRLVVLSACRSGVERFYGGEGMMGLSRSFIAAGAPLVVASLWPVESDSTAELMVAFHRHRKADRLPTAEALRRASLDLLQRPDGRYRHPYYWAAFAAFGGHTDF